MVRVNTPQGWHFTNKLVPPLRSPTLCTHAHSPSCCFTTAHIVCDVSAACSLLVTQSHGRSITQPGTVSGTPGISSCALTVTPCVPPAAGYLLGSKRSRTMVQWVRVRQGYITPTRTHTCSLHMTACIRKTSKDVTNAVICESDFVTQARFSHVSGHVQQNINQNIKQKAWWEYVHAWSHSRTRWHMHRLRAVIEKYSDQLPNGTKSRIITVRNGMFLQKLTLCCDEGQCEWEAGRKKNEFLLAYKSSENKEIKLFEFLWIFPFLLL